MNGSYAEAVNNDSGTSSNPSVLTPGNTATARARMNNLVSHVNIARSCTVSSSHACYIRNLNGSRGGVYHACIDGGADTGLFNPTHGHVKSTTERTAELHMVGPE